MIELPLPDIFGNTVFCEDIRQEVDGKFIYIGVYTGPIIFHVPLPAIIPNLAFAVTLSQRKSIFVSRVGLRIFLPGDTDNAASIQGELGETAEGAFNAQLSAESETLHPDAQTPSSEESYPTISATLRFSQIHVKQPGLIRVRAIVRDNIVRLGSIAVSPLSQPNPSHD
jgi:hypothetical protein